MLYFLIMSQANEKAMIYCERILSMRPHSVFEVENKLKKKGFGSKCASEVIDFYKKEGWLDDTKFAKGFVEEIKNIKPMGQGLVGLRLKQRGIEEDLIEKTLEQNWNEIVEQKMLEKCFEKRNRLLPPGLSKQKRKERLVRYLAAKGFGYGMILEHWDSQAWLYQAKESILHISSLNI